MLRNSIKIEIKTITPRYAAELLKNNTCNRDVNIRQVNILKGKILRGEWTPVTCDAIGVYEDGSIANGQHRLMAIQLSGKTVESLFISGIPKSSSISIDTGRARSAFDNVKIATGEDWYTRRLASAVALASKQRNKKLTHEDHLHIVKKHADTLKFVKSIAEGKLSRELGRYVTAACICALFNDVEADREQIKRFFNIACNREYPKNETETTLVDFIQFLRIEHARKNDRILSETDRLARFEKAIFDFLRHNEIEPTVPRLKPYLYANFGLSDF